MTTFGVRVLIAQRYAFDNDSGKNKGNRAPFIFDWLPALAAPRWDHNLNPSGK